MNSRGTGDNGRKVRVSFARSLAIALLSAAMSLAMTLEGEASSRICRQLEAQLADVGQGGRRASSAEVRRYDRAIEAQLIHIDSARRNASRLRCRVFDGGSCGAAQAELIDRMERNLRSLQRKRDQLASAGRIDPRRERARLMSALDANDCRDYEVADTRQPRPPRGGNLLEQLFGIQPGTEESYRREQDDTSTRIRTTIDPTDRFSGGGSYRTLCVRTCDGYFWPISYSSSRSDFQRDEQNCQSMCPGSEVRLFSHLVPDEESAAMVDGFGTPYTDLPNAFKYKDIGFKKPESCSCKSQRKNYSIIAGNGGGVAPEPTPEAEADPQADAPSPLAADESSPLAANSGGDAEAASVERKVRVVGPAYLPDPPAAEDPPVPGRTAVQ